MSTIAENLQTIQNSTSAIKQAIIDKGGTVEGDITTWADAIQDINVGNELTFPITLVEGDNGEIGKKLYDYINSNKLLINDSDSRFVFRNTEIVYFEAFGITERLIQPNLNAGGVTFTLNNFVIGLNSDGNVHVDYI